MIFCELRDEIYLRKNRKGAGVKKLYKKDLINLGKEQRSPVAVICEKTMQGRRFTLMCSRMFLHLQCLLAELRPSTHHAFPSVCCVEGTVGATEKGGSPTHKKL